ncbi:MAG: hypothetical protein HC896_05490 [Bacteroidales bacterium]|nr:hypothetical protein [Bacteroidales bacterium]
MLYGNQLQQAYSWLGATWTNLLNGSDLLRGNDIRRIQNGFGDSWTQMTNGRLMFYTNNNLLYDSISKTFGDTWAAVQDLNSLFREQQHNFWDPLDSIGKNWVSVTDLGRAWQSSFVQDTLDLTYLPKFPGSFGAGTNAITFLKIPDITEHVWWLEMPANNLTREAVDYLLYKLWKYYKDNAPTREMLFQAYAGSNMAPSGGTDNPFYIAITQAFTVATQTVTWQLSAEAAQTDAILPTLTNAVANSATEITLTFSEPVLTTHTGWTVAGVASTPTVDDVNGFSSTTIRLLLDAPIVNGESVTISYDAGPG